MATAMTSGLFTITEEAMAVVNTRPGAAQPGQAVCARGQAEVQSCPS